MIKPAPPQVRGIAGVVLLFSTVALIAGLGFDFMRGDSARFSVIGEPGGRAVLGIGVVASVVLVAHAMRFLLGKKPPAESEAD